MKMFLIIASLFSSIIANSQCQNGVTVENGTQVVNGVLVTATPSGVTYYGGNCQNSSPYLLGNTGSTHGTGQYSFTFSPSVDALTLNIVAIDNINSSNYEEVELLVNGQHYNVTSVGIINYCNSTSNTALPVITENGRIGDLPGDQNSSNCKDLTISGDINSLTVINHMIGNAYGINFSLRICEGILNVSDFQKVSAQLFPNPFNVQTTLHTSRILNDASINIFNVYGQKIREIKNIFGDTFILKRDDLSTGLYILQIRQADEIFFNTKMLIKD